MSEDLKRCKYTFHKYNAGDVYGRLTLVEKSHQNKWGTYLWKAKCECGNTTFVQPSYLSRKKNPTVSCGCFRDEMIVSANTIHGFYYHPDFGLWKQMIARCYKRSHTSFHSYGGRGITVCKRWKDSFENFISDMGSRPNGTMLERLNNNGNYEPSNCIWADNNTQSRNKRTSVFVNLKGKRIVLEDAARQLGIAQCTIINRSKYHNKSYQECCDFYANGRKWK